MAGTTLMQIFSNEVGIGSIWQVVILLSIIIFWTLLGVVGMSRHHPFWITKINKYIAFKSISGHVIELLIQYERIPKYGMKLGKYVLKWCIKNLILMANLCKVENWASSLCGYFPVRVFNIMSWIYNHYIIWKIL